MKNTTQLPDDFSNMIGLGTPQAEHPVKKSYRIGYLVAGLVLFGAGGVVSICALGATYTAWQKHGSAMIDDTLITPGLSALLLLFLGMIFGLAAYANWKKRVVVYQKGFAYCDRRGVQAWIWDDIISMTSSLTRQYTTGIYSGTSHQYTLLNKQGGRLVLNDALLGVENLAAAIDEAIFPHLYAQVADQFSSGQALSFGPVQIRKSGITIGKKIYAWPEVGQVSVDKGFLWVVKKDGGRQSKANVLASVIPNLRVLLSIIDQVRE